MTDKNVIKGNLKEAEGKIQSTIGKATGSTEDRIAGAAKQAVGKVQAGVGHAKDAEKRDLDKD